MRGSIFHHLWGPTPRALTSIVISSSYSLCVLRPASLYAPETSSTNWNFQQPREPGMNESRGCLRALFFPQRPAPEIFCKGNGKVTGLPSRSLPRRLSTPSAHSRILMLHLFGPSRSCWWHPNQQAVKTTGSRLPRGRRASRSSRQSGRPRQAVAGFFFGISARGEGGGGGEPAHVSTTLMRGKGLGPRDLGFHLLQERKGTTSITETQQGGQMLGSGPGI